MKSLFDRWFRHTARAESDRRKAFARKSTSAETDRRKTFARVHRRMREEEEIRAFITAKAKVFLVNQNQNAVM